MKLLISFLVVSALCACANGAPAAASHKKSYIGETVLRVIPTSSLQLFVLKSLAYDNQVTFWNDVGGVGKSVDIMVHSDHLQEVLSVLRTANIGHSVLIEDVQVLIDQQEEDEIKTRRAAARSSNKALNLAVYHSFSEIMSWLDELSNTYSQLCSVETIGQSYEGKAIKVIKIGTSTASNTPAVWIDGGIHAREWLSPATIVYMISQLVEKYATDSEVKELVDKVNWYVLPMHNPDGYEYSRSTERLWRKNRKPTGQSSWWWGECIGTDLNRNWDYYWMHTGASSDGCSDIYGGSAPFSEPESKAVSDYVMGKKSEIKAFLTFHSYSQLWMTPWGYTSSVPSDYSQLKALAESAVSALESVHGTNYGPVQSSTNALYAAAGGSDDWAKGMAGIKWSYTIELRDTGRYGFVAPASEIVPTGEETWAGVKVVGKHVMNGN